MHSWRSPLRTKCLQSVVLSYIRICWGCIHLCTDFVTRYEAIVKYKTAFYSFYLPVGIAMYMVSLYLNLCRPDMQTVYMHPLESVPVSFHCLFLVVSHSLFSQCCIDYWVFTLKESDVSYSLFAACIVTCLGWHIWRAGPQARKRDIVANGRILPDTGQCKLHVCCMGIQYIQFVSVHCS